MKKIVLMIALLVLLYGCSFESMSGMFVKDVQNDASKDDFYFAEAVERSDVGLCKDIVFSLKQEECLILIARKDKNPDVCYFLEDDVMIEACLGWV